MSTNETTIQKIVTTQTSHQNSEASRSRAYIETPNLDPSSMDVLHQFRANMATLEDLSGRLRFMMSEIRGLIRK